MRDLYCVTPNQAVAPGCGSPGGRVHRPGQTSGGGLVARFTALLTDTASDLHAVYGVCAVRARECYRFTWVMS